jgi:RNA polymerase sigma-70 factor (ECF subfamily)
MGETTDEHHKELVERAAEGDRPAVDELLEMHLPQLLAYVRLRAGPALRNAESSLDFVNSACRQVLQDLPRFEIRRDEADFKRWLYTTVERKMVDRARRMRVEVRGAGRGGDASVSAPEAHLLSRAWADFVTPSHDAAMREELARVEEAFTRLPDNYREVILQVRILGRSPADLAGELAPTAGAVRVLLHRALARLAKESKLGPSDLG